MLPLASGAIRFGARRLLTAAAVLAAFAGGPVRAVEPNFHFAGSVWRADLIGDGDTGGGSSAESFDLRGTLDLEADDTVPAYEAWFRYGKNRIIFGFESSSYDGARELSTLLTYDGLDIQPGTRVRTDFEFDRKRLLYERRLFEGKKLAVGLLIGLEDYEIKSQLRPDRLPRQEAKLDARIPVIGPSIQYLATERLRIYGEATAIALDAGGVESRVLTSYAVAEYAIVGRFLAVALGYRFTFLEGDEEDEARFELEQQGTFLGLSVSL